MSKSVYETGPHINNTRMAGFAAVLLVLVAAIGYALMMGVSQLTVALALVVLTAAFVTFKAARGRRGRKPARASSVILSVPATPQGRAWPVRRDTYIDSLLGIEVPLGDALGVHI